MNLNPHTPEDALEGATTDARPATVGARSELVALLKTGASGQELPAKAEESVESARLRGTVFAREVRPDNRILLDVAFLGFAQAGGGGTYETALVQLCVHLEGAPGRDPVVEIRDTACDPALPDHAPGLGTVKATITLDEH